VKFPKTFHFSVDCKKEQAALLEMQQEILSSIGIIARLTKHYGLIVSAENVLNDKIYIVFDKSTLIEDLKIEEIGSVNDIFQLGMKVTLYFLVFKASILGQVPAPKPSSQLFQHSYYPARLCNSSYR
jgi:hypothetical protein